MGTSAADNVQTVNLIFMFLINSLHKFVTGKRVSRKHYIDNVNNSTKTKKGVYM